MTENIAETNMRRPELLAPAGGMEVLKAAADSGCDAVYLGMKQLNARNGARNFTPDELKQAVELAHSKGVKVYLTLNIDLCQRELGTAARSLALAENIGVDAVLFKDPAVLEMMPFFPGLDFHFSTQAAVSSSAGVRAAGELGVKRVVLARELSFEEIQAAAAVEGVETEVFIQGALCFCCSGRCLLSSWGGGRSGNRGACTSPCRVAWKNKDDVEARPLSMRDLCLADWIDALSGIGVASLKIEGRLKSPQWVGRAVSLYRGILDKSISKEEIRSAAESLGDYTGRDLTDGYLRSSRSGLTGESGRQASANPAAVQPAEIPEIRIAVEEGGDGSTLWQLNSGTAEYAFRTPPRRIANPKRAVTIGEIIASMEEAVRKTKRKAEAVCSDEMREKLLPRNAGNQALEELGAFIAGLDKEDDGLPRGVKLPVGLRELLGAKPVPHPANIYGASSAPGKARMEWNDLESLRAAVSAGMEPVFECNPQSMEEVQEMREAVIRAGAGHATISLPAVVYESQLPYLAKLVENLPAAKISVEVNSWDTWEVARRCGAEMHGGPGLAVTNAAAARSLARLGCKSVYVSMEIDREQLEDLCAAAEVPLSLIVFAHPALMVTRAGLPVLFREGNISDARGIGLSQSRSGTLTVLRSLVPMDWRGIRNPAVRAASIVADFHGVGGSGLPKNPSKPFLFNYDRRLR